MLKTVKIMDAPPKTPPDSEEFVRNAIEKHRACYERWNEFEMVNGVRTHTSYGLRLCGGNRHDGAERDAAAGIRFPAARFAAKLTTICAASPYGFSPKMCGNPGTKSSRSIMPFTSPRKPVTAARKSSSRFRFCTASTQTFRRTSAKVSA